MHKFRLVMAAFCNKISTVIPEGIRRLRIDDPVEMAGIAANSLSMRGIVRGKTGLLTRGYQPESFFLIGKKQGYSVATLPSLARALPFDPTPAVGLGSRNE